MTPETEYSPFTTYCFKETVEAAKIDEIYQDPSGSQLWFEKPDGTYFSIKVTAAWIEWHRPEVGNYLLKNKGGYMYTRSAKTLERDFIQIK